MAPVSEQSRTITAMQHLGGVARMSTHRFYDSQESHSAVKTAIVTKYFKAWARIMLPRSRHIAYVDLFCGPGIYSNGSPSTPVQVLDFLENDAAAAAKTITVFNDVNPDFTSTLNIEIERREYGALAHRPVVTSLDALEALATARGLVVDMPALHFVDPWGYKGISLQLLASTLCEWGCECVLFFNYNRINPGLDNELVTEHMEALFGRDRASGLAQMLPTLDPDEREIAIIEAISAALLEAGAAHVLPFRFVDANGSRTSHHLVFMTKHELGYRIMKDVMASASSGAEQGVPLLEYNPATVRQPLLFEYARPLDELGDLLAAQFAGKSLTVMQIFIAHHVGRRYVLKNYKQALIQLEDQGRIKASPPATERRAHTMADGVVLSFPE